MSIHGQKLTTLQVVIDTAREILFQNFVMPLVGSPR